MFKTDETSEDVVSEEEQEFFMIDSHYEIQRIGKFKSYNEAFDAGEELAKQNNKILLLYFDKDFGIDMFEEYLYFLTKEGAKNGK
jgi:hypothetical protein